jgi:hypothetical protein
MFSQFRQAVENIAVQQRISTDTPSDEKSSSNSSQSSAADTSLSPTSSLSSSQLAESALSNLRKSFAANRTGPVMAKSASLPTADSDKPRQKLNLEERLRASLSGADITTASLTTNPSNTTPSASAASVEANSPSPASTPLPDSPITPLETQGSTQSSQAQEPEAEPQGHPTDSFIEQTASTTPIGLEGELHPDTAAEDAQMIIGEAGSTSSEGTSDSESDKGAQAPQESDGRPSKPSSSIDTQAEGDEPLNATEMPSVVTRENGDIEALQKRLKQVERRFSGGL